MFRKLTPQRKGLLSKKNSFGSKKEINLLVNAKKRSFNKFHTFDPQYLLLITPLLKSIVPLRTVANLQWSVES